MRKGCQDCGTRLEENFVCPNCDEAAFILDWQEVERPSEEFLKEANEGYKRATDRERATK